MPKRINRKALTAKEHRQWKKVFASARARGLSRNDAGASATNAVKKTRKAKSRKKR